MKANQKDCLKLLFITLILVSYITFFYSKNYEPNCEQFLQIQRDNLSNLQLI